MTGSEKSAVGTEQRRLFGRDHESAELQLFLTGPHGALLLRGEAGVGKTALMPAVGRDTGPTATPPSTLSMGEQPTRRRAELMVEAAFAAPLVEPGGFTVSGA